MDAGFVRAIAPSGHLVGAVRRRAFKATRPNFVLVGSKASADTVETPVHQVAAVRELVEGCYRDFQFRCHPPRLGIQGLNGLQELVGEYSDWRENLPDNLSGSMLAEKLDAVADLDFTDALGTVQEASCADLPRGFGKD